MEWVQKHVQYYNFPFYAMYVCVHVWMCVCLKWIVVGEPTLWCAPGQGEGAEVAGGPQSYPSHCHSGGGKEEDNRGREEEWLREVVGHVHHQWVSMAWEVMRAWRNGKVSKIQTLVFAELSVAF